MHKRAELIARSAEVTFQDSTQVPVFFDRINTQINSRTSTKKTQELRNFRSYVLERWDDFLPFDFDVLVTRFFNTLYKCREVVAQRRNAFCHKVGFKYCSRALIFNGKNHLFQTLYKVLEVWGVPPNHEIKVVRRRVKRRIVAVAASKIFHYLLTKAKFDHFSTLTTQLQITNNGKCAQAIVLAFFSIRHASQNEFFFFKVRQFARNELMPYGSFFPAINLCDKMLNISWHRIALYPRIVDLFDADF